MSYLNKYQLNLHSRMDLNGAGGMWDPIGAKLYSVITVRWHPPQPVDLCKQVYSGRGVVLKDTQRSFHNSFLKITFQCQYWNLMQQ